MNENSILPSPDDSGWYFFKRSKKDDISVVFVDYNGVALRMNEEGETEEMSDVLGLWEPIESQLL